MLDDSFSLLEKVRSQAAFPEHRVSAAASCKQFPLGLVLPSGTSAEDCSPLFGPFFGTMARSDFSMACMFILRFIPL
jgi:hypothetical protein